MGLGLIFTCLVYGVMTPISSGLLPNGDDSRIKHTLHVHNRVSPNTAHTKGASFKNTRGTCFYYL